MKPKTFRKRPVEIQALQWTGNNLPDMLDFVGGPTLLASYPLSKMLEIETLEDVMTARVDDWIINGVRGEFYPCKPDIFELTYEEVTDG